MADKAPSHRMVDGVAVYHYQPDTPNGKPPIVMVHGGAHGGWVWERYARYFSGLGWDCHVLEWFHHGRSRLLSQQEFTGRSITAVQQEIAAVTAALPACHLVGQSMGGLAVLSSAATVRPRSLVLVTPAVPAEVGAAPIPVPVDLSVPFAVPPYGVAKGMFFSTMSDAEAALYYERLQPESAQAVWEATRWTVSLDLTAVTVPTMTVAASADTLTPPDAIRGLARLLGSRHVEHPDMGHTDVLLKSTGWQAVAADIEAWLRAR